MISRVLVCGPTSGKSMELCATQAETLRTEFLYFSEGVNITQKMNIIGTLQNSSIIPSNTETYSSNDIVSALKR